MPRNAFARACLDCNSAMRRALNPLGDVQCRLPSTVLRLERCPTLPGCSCCSKGVSEWDWGFVDCVFCICLEDRPDRFAESAAELHRIGLCTRVIYIRVRRPTADEFQHWQAKHVGARLSAGGLGCGLSHQAAASLALALGAQRALILEDDAEFLSWATSSAIHRLKHQMDEREDWDVWHLGWFPFCGRVDKITDWSVWRLRSVCTVAYVASVSGLSLVANADLDQSIDFWIMNHCRQLGSFPKLVWQRESPSSVDEDWSAVCSENLATRIKSIASRAYCASLTAVDTIILVLIPLVLVLALILALAALIRWLANVTMPSVETRYEPWSPMSIAMRDVRMTGPLELSTV
jgi:hypothetical protein